MNILFLLLSLSLQSPAFAKINIVTTTSDLAEVVKEVGGNEVQVDSIAKGTQDPHFIEAKPSYMVKVSKAQLLISSGLELEIGWLPSIIRGARNPDLKVAEASSAITPIEIPDGKISRAEGDVHPDGNPHYMLDPLNAGKVALFTAEKLGEVDPEHKKEFMSQAEKLKSRMEIKTKEWRKRIEKTGIKQVITYHKTLNYFLKEFGLSSPINLEPKPGIPPTSKHIIEVLNVIKNKNIKVILIENFFDATAANRIKEEFPKIRIYSVPVQVNGDPKIKTLDDLYENLVKTLEEK